jgi:hypothetical protein
MVLIISGKPRLNAHQDLGLKIATPVGSFFGQLFFGWLADIVGRKRMCELLHFPLAAKFLSGFQTVLNSSS